jgi:hypothetical protein
MAEEKAGDIFFIFMGLFFAIGFRYIGRTVIENRKKINKFLHYPHPEKDFGPFTVTLSQISFLIVGVLFFLIGLVRFLS